MPFYNYDYNNKPVIHGIQRYSKPGCRRYVTSDNLPRVLNGMGISILSTSEFSLANSKRARAYRSDASFENDLLVLTFNPDYETVMK